MHKVLTQYILVYDEAQLYFVRVLAFSIDMMYTLRKRYAHDKHASGMPYVRAIKVLLTASLYVVFLYIAL